MHSEVQLLSNILCSTGFKLVLHGKVIKKVTSSYHKSSLSFSLTVCKSNTGNAN